MTHNAPACSCGQTAPAAGSPRGLGTPGGLPHGGHREVLAGQVRPQPAALRWLLTRQSPAAWLPRPCAASLHCHHCTRCVESALSAPGMPVIGLGVNCKCPASIRATVHPHEASDHPKGLSRNHSRHKSLQHRRRHGGLSPRCSAGRLGSGQAVHSYQSEPSYACGVAPPQPA